MGNINISQVDKIVTSPSILKKYLKENSISLKKRLGQNFLFDKNVINKLIKNMNLTKNDIVFEIGPGIGNVTLFYLPMIKYAFLIEIDKGLVNILKKNLTLQNTEIIHSDFLKLNLNNILKKEKKYKLFSNLPYSSASQIIIKIIDNLSFFDETYLMVPEVLFKRMHTEAGNKDYSRFTVIVQSFLDIKPLFRVSRNCFFPVPEVDSMFIKLLPDNKNRIAEEEKTEFKEFVNRLFLHRRKKINKVLGEYIALLEQPCIDLTQRIGDISVEQIIKLFKKIILFSDIKYRK